MFIVTEYAALTTLNTPFITAIYATGQCCFTIDFLLVLFKLPNLRRNGRTGNIISIRMLYEIIRSTVKIKGQLQGLMLPLINLA